MGGNLATPPSKVDEEPAAAPTLSAVYQRYFDDPTRRMRARTMLAHQTTRRVVEDVIGGSNPITDVTRETCRDLFGTLRWLPVNYSKIYGDLTACEVAALGKSGTTAKTLNATNLNAYMARLAVC